MSDEKWQKRIGREKQRVLALEQIIEDKTRQLYLANQELRQHNEQLEKLVEDRTIDLRAALEDAEAASRAKTEFVAHMSHELRTPMHGLSGTIDELTRTMLNDQQRRLVDLCQDSSARLLAVIGEVLDFSRIEAGKLELDLKPACLQDVLANTVASFASSIEQKGLVLRSEVVADELVWVLTDSHALSQILANLLSNSIKFTDEGEVFVRIEATVEDRRVRTKWQVTDTGCGMTEDASAQVFNAFKQADAGITRRYGGTGLGLSIVKGLVEAMGGDIHVESKLGQGTTFTLQIDYDRANPGIVAGSTSSGSGLPILAGKQVLIVDDHPVNRTLCEAMLSDVGCDLIFAENAAEAFDQVERNAPDLILMDCHMSDMSGIEVSRHLRDQGFTSPILAVSADATLENVEAVAGAGMQGLLCKPFRRTELFDAITNSVSASGCHFEVNSEPEATSEPFFCATSALEILDGDSEILDRLCEVFLSELPRATNGVCSAIENADSQELRRAAHSLKGAASIVSASRLTSMAGMLEASAAQGSELSCSADEFAELSKETRAAIRKHLARG